MRYSDYKVGLGVILQGWFGHGGVRLDLPGVDVARWVWGVVDVRWIYLR